jgi:hypothetical protein
LLIRATWPTETPGARVCTQIARFSCSDQTRRFRPCATHDLDGIHHRFVDTNSQCFGLSEQRDRTLTLAPELAPGLADLISELPDDSVADNLVIVGHANGSSLQHEAAPTVEQVPGHARSASHDQDAGSLVQTSAGLNLDDAKLLDVDQRRRWPPSVMIAPSGFTTCLGLCLGLHGHAHASGWSRASSSGDRLEMSWAG